MTIEEFKDKWKEDIKKGITNISDDGLTAVADRFNGDDFMCDRKHINKIQADLRKMGFISSGVGFYTKDGTGLTIDNLKFRCDNQPSHKEFMTGILNTISIAEQQQNPFK